MGNTRAEDRTLTLTLAERYALVRLLPDRGDFATLTRIRNMQTVLQLGDTEAEARHLRVAGNQIGSVTDPGQDPAETLAVGMAELQRATAVVVSNGMYDIAINALKSAEQAKALPLDAFSLYEKLVRAPIDEAVAEAEQIAREAVDAPLPAPPERA